MFWLDLQGTVSHLQVSAGTCIAIYWLCTHAFLAFFAWDVNAFPEGFESSSHVTSMRDLGYDMSNGATNMIDGHVIKKCDEKWYHSSNFAITITISIHSIEKNTWSQT